MPMIQVEVVGLQWPRREVALVILGEVGTGARHLTIAIARPEAVAIELALVGEQASRPLTHDLLQSVFEVASLVLERVVVTELRETTFYAELRVWVDDIEQVVSCRPSDAIALALRLDAPMYVEEAVLDEAGVVISPEDTDAQDPDEMLEQFRDFIDSIEPEDFGS